MRAKRRASSEQIVHRKLILKVARLVWQPVLAFARGHSRLKSVIDPLRDILWLLQGL
jgi:hypothetical protein